MGGASAIIIDGIGQATPKTQNRNRVIDFQGESHTLIEWAEQTGLDYKVLRQRRYYGWAPPKLFSPIKKRKSKAS